MGAEDEQLKKLNHAPAIWSVMRIPGNSATRPGLLIVKQIAVAQAVTVFPGHNTYGVFCGN